MQPLRSRPLGFTPRDYIYALCKIELLYIMLLITIAFYTDGYLSVTELRRFMFRLLDESECLIKCYMGISQLQETIMREAETEMAG